MFDKCKNQYDACDKAITFIYGQDYLDKLDEESYLILVRQAKFLFESGMRWQKERRKQKKINNMGNQNKPMCHPATWLKSCYPTTIVNDRYHGTYSHGEWLAFACDFWDVPEDIEYEDSECEWFWGANEYIVGKGRTPQEAFNNLKEQMALLKW